MTDDAKLTKKAGVLAAKLVAGAPVMTMNFQRLMVSTVSSVVWLKCY
jgi:hypothetical protein